MPATRQALTLEQEFGRRVGRLWRDVALNVSRQFDSVASDDLQRAFAYFVATAAPTIMLGQREAQRIAAAFAQQYVEVEAGRAFRAEPEAAAIAGTTRDGERLGFALAGAVGLTWRALRTGHPTSTALSIARAHIRRLAGQAVSDAADRELEHQAERQPRLLRGWTWVAVGASCIACLAQQDGETHPWSTPARRHGGCDCRRVPVITGIPDVVTRPTGDELFRALSPLEQTAIFKNAGADKAALIRSGEASLADFVARDLTAAGPVITEAPLAAVAAGA